MTGVVDRNLLTGFAIALMLAGCLAAFVRALPVRAFAAQTPDVVQPRPLAAWAMPREIDWRPRSRAKAPESQVIQAPAPRAAPSQRAEKSTHAKAAPATAPIQLAANGAVAVPAAAANPGPAAPGAVVAAPAAASGDAKRDAAAGQALFGPGDVDVPPRALFAPKPAFPAAAQRLGLAAEVILTLVIDADGHVERVDARCVSCDASFLRATRETARTWRFAPARLRNEPVRVRVEQRIHFDLDDE